MDCSDGFSDILSEYWVDRLEEKAKCSDYQKEKAHEEHMGVQEFKEEKENKEGERSVREKKVESKENERTMEK